MSEVPDEEVMGEMDLPEVATEDEDHVLYASMYTIGPIIVQTKINSHAQFKKTLCPKIHFYVFFQK